MLTPNFGYLLVTWGVVKSDKRSDKQCYSVENEEELKAKMPQVVSGTVLALNLTREDNQLLVQEGSVVLFQSSMVDWFKRDGQWVGFVKVADVLGVEGE